MALVKCKECGEAISSKAQMCPTCGIKVQKTNGPLAVLFIAGLVVFIVVKLSVQDSPSSAPTASVDHCNDTMMAFVMSQNFVKKRLKSPSSAEFPYINEDGVSVEQLAPCRYSVSAYVDSQNGYGATLRSRYSVVMTSTPDGKTWSTADLVLR